MVLYLFYSYNTYPYFYSRGSYFGEAHLTKIPMARTNKPDIKPKRTKKVREGLPLPNSVISPAISVSVLIPQDISTVDKAFDWLVADLVQQEKKLVDSHCYERKSGLTFFFYFLPCLQLGLRFLRKKTPEWDRWAITFCSSCLLCSIFLKFFWVANFSANWSARSCPRPQSNSVLDWSHEKSTWIKLVYMYIWDVV